MPSSRNYMIRQKLSDYQIEKILGAFAAGISAKDALSGLARGRAANTVFGIYALVEKRLLEIGYYREPSEFLAWTQEPEIGRVYDFGPIPARIEAQLHRLRGLSDQSVRFRLADIIFRAENPDLRAHAFFQDICLAIKLTGPLNADPVNQDVWHEYRYIRTIQGQINQLRARKLSRPEHFEMVRNLENMIVEATKRLKRRQRAAAKIKTDAKSRKAKRQER